MQEDDWEMAQDGAPVNVLSAKRHRAAMCLLLSGNVSEAAASAGVGRRTLCRWLKDPQFKAILATLERDAIESAARRLAGSSEKALLTIERILASDSASDGLRLRAAFGLLDHALKWREQVAMDERITSLERRLGVKS